MIQKHGEQIKRLAQDKAMSLSMSSWLCQFFVDKSSPVVLMDKRVVLKDDELFYCSRLLAWEH